MKLSSIQRDILIGTVLGDAYLQKTGEKNARLRLEHGANQKNYLLWKVKNLEQFFQGKPTYLERVHPASGRTYMYWRHQSQSMPFLGKLRRIFYQDGKKHIPENLKKLLTARSLAVWYMDDGYYDQKRKQGYLYLGNVSKEEADCVQGALAAKFHVVCRVYRKKKGHALYFSLHEMKKLHSVVKQHILAQFTYKFPS